ncbi:MAG: enoyl-CoA hydratase [Steroidobacteraceae bacterium]
MSDEFLLTHLEDRVLTLTLNRPERLNALHPPLMRALREALADAAADARVGCVVLTGAGKGFCAGGDIGVAGGKGESQQKTPEQMAADAERAARKGSDTFEFRVNWLRESMESVRLLHDMPKPTIASVNGAAAGAGFGLAAACDFRVVADTAKFSTAFIQVGFSGDYGGTYFLTKLVGPMKARELYLLGDRIDAHEAQRLGLVTKLVSADELQSETRALATRLANGPGIAQRYMKATLNLAEHATLLEVLDAEAQYQTRTGQTEDHKEAAKAFFEKRKPVFKNM